MQKVSDAMREHQGLTSRARIEETFHKYSNQIDDDGLLRQLSKDTAYSAVNDLLESWDIFPNDEEEKRFKKLHFETSFNKFSTNKLSLNIEYANDFVKDVMSISFEEADRNDKRQD